MHAKMHRLVLSLIIMVSRHFYGHFLILINLMLDPRRIIGDEDCLALNIFTPQMPDESSGLPVIVFIHGG